MNYNDESFIWDYPSIKKALADDFPIYVAAKQRVPFKDEEKLREDLGGFIGGIRR